MMKFLKLLTLSAAMMAVSAQACDRPPLGEYDWVGCVQDGIAISYKDTHHGLVGADGRAILMPKYRRMARLNDKLFQVSDGKKYGVIDRDDRLVVPMQYAVINELNDEYFYALTDENGGKTDLIDKTGKVIFAQKYDFYRSASASWIVSITRNNRSKYGVIDYQDNVLIPFEYDFIEGFHDDYVARVDDEVRLLDRRNQLIDSFEDASYYHDDDLAVRKNGKWGVIDKSYQTVIPFMYDSILPVEAGLFPVEKDGKWGMVNRDNQTVVDFQYKFIFGLSDGLAAAIKDDKYGYIDQTGKVVIDFMYDNGRDFHFGLAEVANRVEGLDKHDESQSSLKYGVIDKTGKFIIPPEYDSVLIPFYKNDGRIHVQLGEKYGIFNTDGKPIIDIVYNNISFFDEGRMEVSKDGKGFYIDEEGRQIGGSWLIHEQACGHVEAGQQFEVMLFGMLPIPFEVVSVDVERGKVMTKELLEGEMNEVACSDIPTSAQ